MFGTFFFVEEKDRKESGSEFPRLLIDCTEDEYYSPGGRAGRASQDKLGDRWHSSLFDVQPSVPRETGAGWEIEVDQDPIGPPKAERNFKITMRWK